MQPIISTDVGKSLVNFTNNLRATFEIFLISLAHSAESKGEKLGLPSVVCMGKFGCSFVGETDCAKLSAPEHLHFAPMGW